MSVLEYEIIYEQACKLGRQAWHAGISKGLTGYLPSLDGVVQTGNVASEISLGLVEIPLKKIVGTYTHSRSIAFAQNFMPLMPTRSEFASKWMNLYQAHIEEGIRDPIKVYEYYNLFYVVEGNKRVSVLKAVDAASIHANVIRMVPKKDETDITNCIYYEFMDFYNKTAINTIWFSVPGRFKELEQYLQRYKPNLNKGESKSKHFMADVYRPFRSIYYSLGGDKKSITTGDAFINYIKIYGMPNAIDESHRESISKFMPELDVLDNHTAQQVKTDPIVTPKRSVFTSLTEFITPRKQLKIAFVYSSTPNTSGWVNAHELGRLHIDNVFEDQIITHKIECVPENDEAYDTLKILAEKKYDIIFTTSPTYIAPTLKAAIEFPNVKFFTCAGTHSYNNLTLYFGRIHEPWYLLGMIAGTVTKTNKIGYIAPFPISEVVAGVNAFALGAQAVNPQAIIKPAWTYKWQKSDREEDVVRYLHESGVDIISNESMPIPGNPSKEYGVYAVGNQEDEYKPKIHYAMAIWDWGVFYEQVIQNILSGTWKTVYENSMAGQKPMNFWLGMDTGIVDIMHSNRNVTTPTKKLINSMRKSIIRNEFNIFEGPIYDQNNNLKILDDEIATYEQIITMDWFVKGVEGEIPPLEDLTPADPLSYMRGIVSSKK